MLILKGISALAGVPFFFGKRTSRWFIEVWNESRPHLFLISAMRNGEVWNFPSLRIPFFRTIDLRGLSPDAGAARYLAGGGTATVMP
jgi:hypothetical protein